MQRVSHITQATDLFGTSKHGYTDGAVGTMTPATKLVSAAQNAIQEELSRAVETTASLAAGDYTQLGQAIRGEVAAGAISNCATRTPAGAYAGTFYGGYSTIDEATTVVCGTNGEIQYSADCVTFTQRASAGGYTGTFYAADQSGSITIVAGAAGEIETTSDVFLNVMVKRTQAGAYAGDFRAIIVNGSNVVLGGTSGEIQYNTNQGTGVWTKSTQAGAYAGTFYAGTYQFGLYILFGSGGEIQTSPDMITWTKRTQASAYAGDFRGACSNASNASVPTAIAVGTAGEIQVTTDGISYTRVSPAYVGHSNGSVVLFSGDLLCAKHVGVGYVVAGVGHKAFSVDGTAWVNVSAPYAPTYNAIARLGKANKSRGRPRTVLLVGPSGLIRQSQVFQ